jgi:hypothetical protein
MASRSGLVHGPARPPEEERDKKRTRKPWLHLAWKPILFSGIPAAIAWYYLVVAAPQELPVPPGLKVPFPDLIPYLENIVAWCSEHTWMSTGIAIGLVASTFLASNPTRYAVAQGILILLITGFFYLSIHAPVERLMRAVEQNLPEDRKLPDYLPPPR